jgi:L-aminopeptidase/D-esterase-like protein
LEEYSEMKKALSILTLLAVLSVLAPSEALAQCGRLRHRHGSVTHTHYACVGDHHKHGRSFWSKHRDKLTTAAGALGGAAIGGLAGGGKGAAIGALAGGGGAAVYTYKIRKGRRRSARY